MSRSFALAMATLLIAGCQQLPTQTDSGQLKPTEKAATLRSPYYVLVQAEQTGLQRVMHDASNMYLVFDAPVTTKTVFFDDEGEALTAVPVGNTVGVPGLHSGILIRRAASNSYVATREGVDPASASPSPSDETTIAPIRTALFAQGPARAAMQKALLAVNDKPNAQRPRPVTGKPEVKPATEPSGPVRFYPAPRNASDEASRSTSANRLTPRSTRATGSSRSLQSPRSLRQVSTLSPNEQLYQTLPDGRSLVRIFFASGGRAVVRPDDGLQKLEQLSTNAARINVVGFTDSLGEPTFNRALGLQRARSVANFLQARGVSPNRIQFHSMGETEFLARNDSAAGRALNRRVEVRITPRSNSE